MLAVLCQKNFRMNIAEKRERYYNIARRFPILTPFAAVASEIDVIVRHRINPLAYFQAVAEAEIDARYKGYM